MDLRPVEFHARLAERTIDEDILDVEALWREAVDVCTNPSQVTLTYLEMLRVDLDVVVIADEPPEADHYVISMAPHLTPVHSIRTGGMSGYLEKLGWERPFFLKLDSGDPLRTMTRQFTDSLAKRVRDHLEIKYGGWLSGNEATSLLERLQAEEDAFMNPSRQYIRETLATLGSRYTEQQLQIGDSREVRRCHPYA